jgi:hypothetical protein
LAAAGLCSLVQFPYAAPIYSCYVAPLAFLAMVALLRQFPAIPRSLLVTLWAGYLLFAVLRVTPGFIHNMGFRYQPEMQTQTLDLPRAGGLRVDAQSAAVYSRLIPLIQQHAGAGEIYAGRDCPEVYFLAGYRNPTPDIYDFLRGQAGSSEPVLQMLDARAIRVVVLNLNPPFSGMVPGDLQRAIAERFPNEQQVGNFEVRWRP